MANQKPAKNLPKCQFVSMVYSIPSAPGVPCEVRCLGTKTPLQQTTCRSRVPLEHKGMFTSSLHPSKKPTKKHPRPRNCRLRVWPRVWQLQGDPRHQGLRIHLSRRDGFSQKGGPFVFLGGGNRKKQKKYSRFKIHVGIGLLGGFCLFFC